jgi:hypothetical protein
MDKFWRYFMPFVFAWSFVAGVMDRDWILAMWVLIAAAWWGLYIWMESINAELLRYIKGGLTDYSK